MNALLSLHWRQRVLHLTEHPEDFQLLDQRGREVLLLSITEEGRFAAEARIWAWAVFNTVLILIVILGIVRLAHP